MFERKLAATPLRCLVLIMIETTDLLFATDSIPAVLAITHEPFIVFTSNVFAIMGLRSLYFALAGMMEVFHFLHYGLSVILIFIGVKMLISDYCRFRRIGAGSGGGGAGLLDRAVADVSRKRRSSGWKDSGLLEADVVAADDGVLVELCVVVQG